MLSTAAKLFINRTLRRRCDPQSCCAQRARQLLEELAKQVVLIDEIPTQSIFFSSRRASEWARCQFQRLPHETQTQIMSHVLEHAECSLYVHRCNVVALETVAEAKLQVSQHETYHEMFYGFMTTVTDREEYLLFWLYVIELYLCNGSYSDAPDEHTIAWFLPKHMGRGMESLKILHEQRKASTRIALRGPDR
jgi:hypothetical protein